MSKLSAIVVALALLVTGFGISHAQQIQKNEEKEGVLMPVESVTYDGSDTIVCEKDGVEFVLTCSAYSEFVDG